MGYLLDHIKISIESIDYKDNRLETTPTKLKVETEQKTKSNRRCLSFITVTA